MKRKELEHFQKEWWDKPCDIYEKNMPGKGRGKSKASELVQKDKISKSRNGEEGRSVR